MQQLSYLLEMLYSKFYILYKIKSNKGMVAKKSLESLKREIKVPCDFV